MFWIHLGIININDTTHNYCVQKNFNNSLIKKCTQEDPVNITIHSSLSNPIKKNNYLKNYYNLNSIDEIIKYINGNNLLFSTKNRLLDFTFITYYDTIQQNIDKWIELIKTLFNEYKLTDLNATKVLKKITKKFNNYNDYPLNLLIKIKKYLDNNI